jgi:hypothetical protein
VCSLLADSIFGRGFNSRRLHHLTTFSFSIQTYLQGRFAQFVLPPSRRVAASLLRLVRMARGPTHAYDLRSEFSCRMGLVACC